MYDIGIDTGGTFTDCIVIGEGIVPIMTKAETTPENATDGVMNSIDRAAEALSLSVQNLLGNTRYLIHGTTHVTNTMIERKGVRTGLITTKGFEDVIFIGRGYQKAAGLSESEMLHESRLDKAEPIIPRNLVMGVSERTDFEGEVIVPLNIKEAENAVDFLLGQKVESIGVCFLWSFLNPGNEDAMREIIRRKAPAVFVSCSRDAAPLISEYERTATVALTCYLGPRVAQYVDKLDARLREQGFAGQFFLMHAAGGVMEAHEASVTPLLLLDSGPVGGTLGSKALCNALGKENMICTDMGGTSFDVSIVSHGQTFLIEKPVLAKYSYLSPSIDIASIGAGGGSLVWVDTNGVLQIGPGSAGAVPGPACYGAGGITPTITDVDVVLGFLNPDFFLGGRVALHRELAETAIGGVAEKVRMEATDVAMAAFGIVNSHMADLIRSRTVEKGLDPKEFAILSYGGAGSTHVPFVARQLGIEEVYIPAFAPAFSALGMLNVDILYSRQKTFAQRLPLSKNDQALLWEEVANQKQMISSQFDRIGITEDSINWNYLLFMKYGSQVHEIPISLSQLRQGADINDQLFEAIDRRYDELYGSGSGYRPAGVETTKIRVEGRFLRSPLSTVLAGKDKAQPRRSKPKDAVKYRRGIYFPPIGLLSTDVYDGNKLVSGNILTGPCVIERVADTIVIPPDAEGVVDSSSNIRITLK